MTHDDFRWLVTLLAFGLALYAVLEIRALRHLHRRFNELELIILKHAADAAGSTYPRPASSRDREPTLL